MANSPIKYTNDFESGIFKKVNFISKSFKNTLMSSAFRLKLEIKPLISNLDISLTLAVTTILASEMQLMF